MTRRAGPTPVTRMLHVARRAGGPGLALAQRAERARVGGWPTSRRTRREAARRRQDDAALARHDAAAYRRIWQSAADVVGAEVRELGGGFLSVRRGRAETVVRRNLAMVDHPVSIALALDKALMARLLAAEGVPVAEQVEADRTELSAAAARLAAGGRWVVKPASDTGGGYGVTCGVESEDDLWRSWLWAAVWGERIVLERQVDGEEYRLLFLDGELLDAVRRHPPTVVGDGRSTVAELIAAENGRRVAAGADEVGRAVKVDLDCELALRRAGLGLRSVPGHGRRVTVKGNVGDNAAADNVTARDLCPALVAEAGRAASLARLRFAGVDVVTADPGRSLGEAGGVVLEVNGTPGLQHHYLVREPAGATPVAAALLERLLQEGTGASSRPSPRPSARSRRSSSPAPRPSSPPR